MTVDRHSANLEQEKAFEAVMIFKEPVLTFVSRPAATRIKARCIRAGSLTHKRASDWYCHTNHCGFCNSPTDRYPGSTGEEVQYLVQLHDMAVDHVDDLQLMLVQLFGCRRTAVLHDHDTVALIHETAHRG